MMVIYNMKGERACAESAEAEAWRNDPMRTGPEAGYDRSRGAGRHPPRNVIRFLGKITTVKEQMMEEMISSRMPQAKEKKDLNSSKIRSNFEQKNRKFHEKMESGDS